MSKTDRGKTRKSGRDKLFFKDGKRPNRLNLPWFRRKEKRRRRKRKRRRSSFTSLNVGCFIVTCGVTFKLLVGSTNSL
jgi:hypothetical protein